MDEKPCIAVIDDDASVRDALKSLLAALGYPVEDFASARAFLESASLPATACVIADVQMPEMSGIDLQRHLREQGSELPLIFVTAYAHEAIRAQAIEDGAVAFLSKPVREEALLECLELTTG